MGANDSQTTNTANAQSGLQVAPGEVFIELCLNSGIADHEIRKGLRKLFGEKMLQLTGGKISLGGLATYMKGEMTATQKVPPSADLMLDELNRVGGYLEKIVDQCGSKTKVPLSEYKAKVIQGVDSYCIDENGKVRCYHFFSLVPKDGDEGPITVEYKNEIGTIAFCCAGQSLS